MWHIWQLIPPTRGHMSKEFLGGRQSTIYWLNKSVRLTSMVSMVGAKFNGWVQGHISVMINLVHNTQGTILNQRWQRQPIKLMTVVRHMIIFS